MYSSDLYKRLRAEIDKIGIIDTHEHLQLPDQLRDMGKIDFGRLFFHYASCDLISAGMPKEDMAEVQDPQSKWDIKKKWQALKPYYKKSWNTGYCECLRIAIRDLYGIDDLRDDTVEDLSRKMNNVPRDSWIRSVFDKARIDLAMEQSLFDTIVCPRKAYSDVFIYDIYDAFSHFVIDDLSKDTGTEIASLDDYLGVIDHYFDKFAHASSAFKISRAYDRRLVFGDTSKADAERIFKGVPKKDWPPIGEIRALEDFIIYYNIQKAAEYNLPVKFHTGLQEGNGNDIKNSRAALLVNLFTKYPNVKFDIYHISWPYTEELIDICKNFPNVYIDFAWAWIFNPPAARRYLSDMLETVPASKIHGFGGDFIFVEGSYGHSVIARREITRVLAEKVEEGRFSEEYALWVAKRLLRENAMENFQVGEKQLPVISDQ